MGSNGAEELMTSRSDNADCSETSVEIKIKTLNSETYTLRVDKCMPVPALKEQIATVTGVLSEQQRLICRGKVLKDDQLLSAYHVEDGHTLHLVVRQPLPPPSEVPDYPETDPDAASGRRPGGRTRPRLVLGSFNVSEHADGVIPDLSRIVSAVLTSFGVNNVGNDGEDTDIGENLRRYGLNGLTDSSTRGQPNSSTGAFPNAVPLEHIPPLVIPDSLSTLSQYMSHLRHEFSSNVGGSGSTSQAAGTHGRDGNTALRGTSGQSRLPTPESLAEVLLSARQLLTEQAGECLTLLARQLEEHAGITDSSARMRIQSNAMRSGDLLQKLGALLFELGRTTMTLRMGEAAGEAVVNAGPAVFISTSGPNPIMVQPLPFQPGTGFGAIPFGPRSGFSGGSVGSGYLPRNIDIRIRAGSLPPSTTANQGEPSDAQQPLGQNNPAHSGNTDTVNQSATASGFQPIREREVRVLPIRSVITTVPASVSRVPSDSSHSPLGLFYPVLARVPQVTSRNTNSARTSQTSDEQQPSRLVTGGRPVPESTVRRESYASDGTSGARHTVENAGGFPTRGSLNRFLSTLFPGEQIEVDEVTVQGAALASDARQMGAMEMAVDGQEAADQGVSNDGVFLANLLRQVMPIISQSSPMGSNDASMMHSDMENRNGLDPHTSETFQAIDPSTENADVGTSSCRRDDPPTSPHSKRQKRE